LIVHGGDGPVPLGQTLAVGLQVEAGDRHLPRDDRVYRRAPVADHEQELALREELF